MHYEQAIQFLESLPRYPKGSKTDRVQILLDALGYDVNSNPQYIHVTGTNGKGSVSAMLESVTRVAGHTTGLFTSPHLFSYNERIKYNGTDIDDNVLANYIERVKIAIEDTNLETCVFEVMFVIALLYFQDKDVQIVVIEAGIGGTHDATNYITGDIAIITNVDEDHAALLGNTRAEIARDKCGIIKPGAICITAETDSLLLNIITQHAQQQSAKLRVIHNEYITSLERTLKYQQFNYRDLYNVQIPLIGEFQLRNAAIVIEAAHALHIPEFAIRKGLQNTVWPLRLEVIHEQPIVIADAGHNIHGITAITDTIKNYLPLNAKIIIINGSSHDKPYLKMSRLIAPLADELIISQAQYLGADPQEIYEALIKDGYNAKHMTIQPTVSKALALAFQLAAPQDVILVLGGLYLAAEAKAEIKQY